MCVEKWKVPLPILRQKKIFLINLNMVISIAWRYVLKWLNFLEIIVCLIISVRSDVWGKGTNWGCQGKTEGDPGMVGCLAAALRIPAWRRKRHSGRYCSAINVRKDDSTNPDLRFLKIDSSFQIFDSGRATKQLRDWFKSVQKPWKMAAKGKGRIPPLRRGQLGWSERFRGSFHREDRSLKLGTFLNWSRNLDLKPKFHSSGQSVREKQFEISWRFSTLPAKRFVRNKNPTASSLLNKMKTWKMIF